MPRPKRQHVRNGVWHVTQRATDSEVFFLSPVDYSSFVHLFGVAIRRARWKVHAFCLIPNHVHLLIQTPEPTLPAGMQFLFATYVEEFNLRHGRRGTLVQGRYKAGLVETETHYLECLRYIASNPVGAGLCERAEDWPWSSYVDGGSIALPIEKLLRGKLDLVLR
ncbi:MAG: transposase [Gaiellaceae bacterium]